MTIVTVMTATNLSLNVRNSYTDDDLGMISTLSQIWRMFFPSLRAMKKTLCERRT